MVNSSVFRRLRSPVDPSRVPPGQSVTQRFPVLTYGPTPRIQPENVVIKVWGRADPAEFSWDALMALPQTTFTYDIHCVTRWTMLDTTWTGIAISDLMQRVRLHGSASHVLIHCYGGYTTNLSLEDFNRPLNLLAHTHEGKPLAADHGGPLRLVVPHLYFWKSAKWVSGLEFLDHDELGFWERNGYHRRGEPFREERYSDD